MLHMSQTLCAACKPYIFHVLHASKKHSSETLCAVCGLFFSYAARELTAILCQIRTKAYNEMACKQNMPDKMCGHSENSILSSSIYW